MKLLRELLYLRMTVELAITVSSKLAYLFRRQQPILQLRLHPLLFLDLPNTCALTALQVA